MRIEPENGTTRRNLFQRALALIVAPTVAKTAACQPDFIEVPPSSAISDLFAKDAAAMMEAHQTLRYNIVEMWELRDREPFPEGMGYNFKTFKHS